MSIKFQCIECGRKYEAKQDISYVCPVCALSQKPMMPVRGVLRIILPYDKLSERLDRYTFQPTDLLPIEAKFLPDYPVGNTPLIAPHRIRSELNFANLFLKDESGNPTGSLKDRASYLIAALALKLGEKKIAVASTGNAASAMAGVASCCGLDCVIFVPQNAPKAKLAQALIYGARLIPIKGSYDEAFELSLKFTEKYGGINRNTAYNPFTIEGKKTAALEIFLQLDYRAPDMIFIPTGDGVILSGIYKGFYDLFQFDWIEKIPQLVAVQAQGSNALVRGIATGSIKPQKGAHSIADSICVAVPRNGIMALKDIESSGGFGVTVSDKKILRAQQYLATKAGIFVEPAAACAFAGFLKSKDQLDGNSTIVILLTGNGLKDVPAVLNNLQLPEPVKPYVDEIIFVDH